MQTDFENGKISSSKHRLTFSQLTTLIDDLYVLKVLINQHIDVYKRMSECNTLSSHQLKFQRVLEDVKRILKFKTKLRVEELSQFKKRPEGPEADDALEQ